jgi:hypothetical protein
VRKQHQGWGVGAANGPGDADDPAIGRQWPHHGQQSVCKLDQVQVFDAFAANNNPHGEHDYGSFELESLARRVKAEIAITH